MPLYSSWGKGGSRRNLRLPWTRDLVKLGVLQNCAEDPKEVAQTLAERTRASVVQVIGRKIVLYRPKRESRPKIELPK